MKITGIDKEKCIKCEACVKDCPMFLFHAPETPAGEKKKIIFRDQYDTCITCGHCISVCPTDAILYEEAEKALEFEAAKKHNLLLNYDDLLKLLRSNRSVRQYKSKPVPKEDLEAILEAMRYAPSASNSQAWHYLVLTDPNKINRIRKATLKLLKTLKKLIKLVKPVSFLLPKNLKEQVKDPSRLVSLDNFIDRFHEGEDTVFFGAPVLLICYAPIYGGKIMAGEDAGIALTYGRLAAQARGIGSCWIGFALSTLSRSKKLRKWLNIPKNMQVTGVMILGYPAVKYQRVPPREPLNVRWS